MSAPHTKRVCQIIKLKPGAEEAYKELHAAAWPSVLAAIARAHIADYSIHYYAPLRLLIAHFKYTGTDYEGDMRKLAQDPETQRWWALTDGLQESLVEGAQGSGRDVPWWLDLEEVFRIDGQFRLQVIRVLGHSSVIVRVSTSTARRDVADVRKSFRLEESRSK